MWSADHPFLSLSVIQFFNHSLSQFDWSLTLVQQSQLYIDPDPPPSSPLIPSETPSKDQSMNSLLCPHFIAL